MTDKQAEQKTSGKSGQSIGFLRAAEKMQISTFEIPLTFLEDLGFSQDKIQAAKYLNRKFISGFYDRVRGIAEKLSFGRSHQTPSTPEAAQTRPADPKKSAKAQGTAKAPVTQKATGGASKPEDVVKPKPKATKRTTKTANPAGQARPKSKPNSQPRKSTKPPTGASSE